MGLLTKIKSFSGGIHPPEEKHLTENLPFEIMPDPKTIVLPLSQHIGRPAKPVVEKGSEVVAGEIVAEADGFISAGIKSPVSGKVLKIAKNSTLSGFPKDCIFISSSENEEVKRFEPLNPFSVSVEDIRKRIKEAGIVGQGGAAFPTFVKLTPPAGKKIEYLILNGCECEPYLTRDYRFMLEKPMEVVEGLKLSMKAAGAEMGIIGIEDNKPEAIKVMQDAVKDEENIFVETVKTKYPQGAEKMLIKAVTGREVPPGQLPLEVGVVIQNIGTAVEIYDAVVNGESPLYASLTVSGKGINTPKNLMVKVGTPIIDVIEFCGGLNEAAVKVVIGGPMMGVGQYDFSAPVMKATSGILALTSDEVKEHNVTACLRCGKCVEVCPLNLMPTRLARLSQLDKLEEAEEIGLNTCMECGSCVYECPANIPLVQWIRIGKKELFKLNQQKKSA